jgi:membrane-associated phospholipid phosphatase
MTAVPDRSRALFALAAVLIALAALVAVEAADLARAVDSAVLDALVAHRGPRWTEAATTVTNTGASPFAYPVALVTAAVVGLRPGRWRAAVAAPVVLVLGVLSRLLLSIVVRDERPPAALHLVPVSGFSFPSGHASSSALLAGALIWLMAQTGLRRPVRLALSTILALWALAVAVSRIYLGVHWVSDIAGSWLLAAAWLTLLPLLAPRPSVDGGRPPARLREPGGPDPDGERQEPDGRRDHRSGTDG